MDGRIMCWHLADILF